MTPEARVRLEGWIGRYENGGSDSEDDWNIAADFREALATIDRYEKVLTDLACYDDKWANEHLKASGSYGGFDEPGAVQAARHALQPELSDA